MTRLSLLVVPQMLREQDEHRDSLARAVELAEAAGQAGFDACYFPEHHGRDDDYPSAPLTLAAYVAGRTPRIGIGTGVALLPLHNPLAFAEQMSTLGALVGDRLHRVGVGMGGLDGDYAAMGVPRAEMRRRFADSLAVIRRLWAGETVTADVGSLRLTEARLYPRPSRPLPLAVGAMAEPSVRRAGLLGLPWITDPSHSLTTLERLAEIYWSAAGSEGEVILMRNAWPAADHESERIWWPHVERSLVEFSVGAGRLREEPGVRIGWSDFRDRLLCGPPEQLVKEACAAAARLDAAEVVIRLGFPTGPGHDAVRAAIRSFGRRSR
ncbi:LLM class flavin-dependent oxidoreductase [Nonomuraea sp. NPDC050478]|uniref:LLM class flavin-dependent oxidoreductase n=1 Tax=Nonomuraea sp. NPDC050478 TaxID=3364365 RepID=UPI0037A8AC5F